MPPRKAKEEKPEYEALPLDQSEEGRMKALEAALTDLTKRFGDGTIVRLGDAAHLVVDVIPTGSLMVDIATGVGGIARGRITEIYGAESSGKTTLCLHIIAEAQKRGGICAFVDMEHALDPLYAGRIGVNMDTLYVSQPDTAEQALEIVEALVRSGALDVVVLDSVAALVPRVEIEGEMGDSHVGIQARLMSQALRKLSGAIKQSNVAVLFTNQLREKIGVMYGCARGDSPVLLADGSYEKISTLVDQHIDKPVMSYNVQTGVFEPSRILNWFNNGPADEFVKFTAISVQDGTTHTFTCTPNHLLLTEYGYEAADEITINTHLIVRTRTLDQDDTGWLGTEMAITSIERVLLPAHEARYDLEIEDNHCYIVDGMIIHNSPETQPGGRALKFYASMRLDVRRIESLKQGSEIIGNRTKVRVTKNKVAPPFKEAEFDIMFTPTEAGISKMGELVDLGADLGIIEKRGAFYRYNDGLLGQGRENAKQFLTENPVIALEIEEAIRAHYGLPSMMR